MTDANDIAGYWTGWYAYGTAADDQRIPFSAFLESVAELEFTGTTLEPNTFAAPMLRELSADVMGEMAGESVIFEKLYHPGPEVHQAHIQYLGRLSEEASRIFGEWHVGTGEDFLSGHFEMVRLSRRTAEADAIFSVESPAFQLPDELTRPSTPPDTDGEDTQS